MKQGYVYILANKRGGTIYIGVTSNLEKRFLEHKRKILDGFTSKYDLSMLVYVEKAHSIEDAIAREKQLKNWKRSWKIALIEKVNPTWRDLSVEWELDPESSSG